jgi:hypothetical protein
LEEDPSYFYGRAAPEALQRFAASARRLVDLTLRMTDRWDELEKPIAVLDACSRALEPLVAADASPRIGAEAKADQRIYFDRARHLGAYVPGFPTYQVDPVVEGRGRGKVRFDISHEGAPGCVFGGSLALFFDMIFQHHGAQLGASGSTVSQDVRYVAPAPLLCDIDFEVWEVSLERRKRQMAARLEYAGETLVECESLQILSRRGAAPDRNPRMA